MKLNELVTSIFCEQKPGVDFDPLEMNLVAQSASLSIADQQLILSFPILLDISVRKQMDVEADRSIERARPAQADVSCTALGNC